MLKTSQQTKIVTSEPHLSNILCHKATFCKQCGINVTRFRVTYEPQSNIQPTVVVHMLLKCCFVV